MVQNMLPLGSSSGCPRNQEDSSTHKVPEMGMNSPYQPDSSIGKITAGKRIELDGKFKMLSQKALNMDGHVLG